MDGVDVFDLKKRNTPYQTQYQYLKGAVPAYVCDLTPPGAKVVEIGCGGGGISSLLMERNRCDALGVEPDIDSADIASNRGLRVEIKTLDEFVTSTQETFDVILLLDILEHLHDPKSALESLTPLLNPGGKFILSVPNVAFWPVRLNLLWGNFDYTLTSTMDFTHIRWFTRKSFATLLKSCRLRQISEHYAVRVWLRPYPWVPTQIRNHFIRALASLLPGLFAFQFVVEARPEMSKVD